MVKWGKHPFTNCMARNLARKIIAGGDRFFGRETSDEEEKVLLNRREYVLAGAIGVGATLISGSTTASSSSDSIDSSTYTTTFEEYAQ